MKRCVRISMFTLNTKQRRTFFKKHCFLYVAGVHKYFVSLPVVCKVIPFFFIRRFFPPRLISHMLFTMHFVFWSKLYAATLPILYTYIDIMYLMLTYYLYPWSFSCTVQIAFMYDGLFVDFDF
jgi:hypothetical protein